MRPAAFRKLALSLKGATEGAHGGQIIHRLSIFPFCATIIARRAIVFARGLRICRVGHIGCFKHEPPEQREKCRDQACSDEVQAASLDGVRITGAHPFQSMRGDELGEQ